jgi:hypothetical protein
MKIMGLKQLEPSLNSLGTLRQKAFKKKIKQSKEEEVSKIVGYILMKY